MSIRKSRWSRVYESSEEELTDLFAARNITAERWAADAFDNIGPKSHTVDTQLWCAEGSIIFRTSDGKISVQPGDTIIIPADLTYQADAGISGCVCYEAPLATSALSIRD